MFKRILSTAVPVGLLVGLVVGLLQVYLTSPLIIESESYEASSVQQDAHTQDNHTHADADEWQPEDGFSRSFFTVISAIVTYLGISLCFSSFMILLSLKNEEVSFESYKGFLWGGAGFISFIILPSISSPPELPGAAISHDLLNRQVWWFFVVFGSVLAFWLISSFSLQKKNYYVLLCAICLWVLPQFIGVPHITEYASSVPAELSAKFAARSIAISLLSWILLGYITHYSLFSMQKK